MFRIAIIGPGSICRTYLDALRNSEKVKVCALAGRDTEKGRNLAEEYGVLYYADQESMYKEAAPDAVLICTPTDTHAEMVRKAIAHGTHVMCEKPFVLNANTAETLIKEAESAGIRLMVMQVVRFWPEYVKVKEMIDTGILGEIKNVYLNRLSAHPTWCTWHRDPERSGGGLYDLHIHDIDYLYHVFGPVTSVYAVGKQEDSGCFNNVSTVLRFAGGESAVAEGFMNMTGTYEFTTNMRINGSAASMEMLNKKIYLENGETMKADQMILYKEDHAAETVLTEKYDPYMKEVEYFAECVLENKAMELVPNRDVVAVLRILGAIEESLKTGKILYSKA